MDRVAAGVGLDHLGAEGVVGVGVTVGGERDRHDGRVVEQVGGHQRGAHQRDGGQRRGAGAHQGQEHDPAEPAQLLEVGLGERVDDGDEGGAGVLLARLGGGEVQPAEGAVLRVRERLQRAVGGDPGQRQALGVDELGLGGSVGQVEGDDAPVLVESGERGVGAGDQELQVVELGRRRAVLDHPRILSELR